MKRSKQYFMVVLLLATFSFSPLIHGTTPIGDQPLTINYNLSKVEKLLEKSYDKYYKIDWDFDLVYHDSKVFVIMEYEKAHTKKFNKVSPENLHKFISEVIILITKALKTDREVHGILREDGTEKATYSFQYKNGNLDIK